MRITNIEWTCENKKCLEQFRLFSNDGAGDETICWNHCPYCGARNDIWIRFVRPNSSLIPPVAIGYEEAQKLIKKKRAKMISKNPGVIFI